MAVRLVNKSKADCDINLFSGRVVRLKPLSHITLDEKITRASVDYYRQLSDLGIYLEKDPEPKIEEKPVETINTPDVDAGVEVTTESTEPEAGAEGQADGEDGAEINSAVAELGEVTEKDLMKHNHDKLVELAEACGLGNLEALSKREIAGKILEAVNAGK